MELILELLYERRRSYTDLGSVICAILLMFSLAGMYHYLSVEKNYEVMNEKEEFAPAMPEVVSCMEMNIKVCMDSLSKMEWELIVSDVVPEISEKVEDAGTIPNIFKGDGDDTLKPAKKKATRFKNKTDESPVHPAASVETIKNLDIPLYNTDTNIEETEKIENIIKFPEPAVKKEISGFLCNGKGYITGYTDTSKFLKDSLIVLPRNNECTGIVKGALNGLEDKVSEIFIPANITYIESGTFDGLDSLIFIEVDARNQNYHSINGILYDKNGKVVAHPNKMIR